MVSDPVVPDGGMGLTLELPISMQFYMKMVYKKAILSCSKIKKDQSWAKNLSYKKTRVIRKLFLKDQKQIFQLLHISNYWRAL